jgi:O-antigen ligase
MTATRRLTLVAGFVALAGAEAALLGSVTVADRIASPTFAALGVVGLVIVGAIAVGLARRPALVAPLVLAAAPFRLPLDFGREHRFFVALAEPGQLGRLLPLYVVLLAAAAFLLWRTLHTGIVRPLPRPLAWAAAAFVAFASISLLWSSDVHAGTNLLAYFLLPFAVLVAVVGRAPIEPWLPRALTAIAIALGLLFAVTGLVQAWTGTLLFYSPNLEISNSYSNYFRVTSLFRDPSLYGRHVVLAIAVVLVAVWARRISLAAATAAVAIMWAGLYFSYSQSSFVALFVTTTWIVFTTGSRTARRLVLVGAAIVLVAAGGLAAAALAGSSAKRVTSDRSRRVELTARVYRAHPVFGVGLGAQPLETQHISTNKGPVARFVSHATPLTIAAELGTIGVVLGAILFVTAVRAVTEIRRRDAAVGIALGAVLLALFVHALFYSGFFEDPVTWFALALAAAYLAAARPAGAQ